MHLDQPLPPALVGKAGFNLDFLPTTYFGKSYLLDDPLRNIPASPATDPWSVTADGVAEPAAAGHRASDRASAGGSADSRHDQSPTTVRCMLFDARNRAQNGWFVVRTLIPAGRTDNALVWHIHPNVIPGWMRPPVVSYNQVGYTPERAKVAVLELDPHARYAPVRTSHAPRRSGQLSRGVPRRHQALGEVAAIPVRHVRLFARFANRAFTRSTTPATAPGHFSSPQTSTETVSGNPLWTLICRCKWITSRCARITESGTGYRTWMMRGRRR